jgi:hypothetical protein
MATEPHFKRDNSFDAIHTLNIVVSQFACCTVIPSSHHPTTTPFPPLPSPHPALHCRLRQSDLTWTSMDWTGQTPFGYAWFHGGLHDTCLMTAGMGKPRNTPLRSAAHLASTDSSAQICVAVATASDFYQHSRAFWSKFLLHNITKQHGGKLFIVESIKIVGHLGAS